MKSRGPDGFSGQFLNGVRTSFQVDFRRAGQAHQHAERTVVVPGAPCPTKIVVSLDGR
jgi:hypothetical protein